MNKCSNLGKENGKGAIVWDSEVWSDISQEGFSELIKALSRVACTLIGQCWDGLLKKGAMYRFLMEVIRRKNSRFPFSLQCVWLSLLQEMIAQHKTDLDTVMFYCGSNTPACPLGWFCQLYLILGKILSKVITLSCWDRLLYLFLSQLNGFLWDN